MKKMIGCFLAAVMASAMFATEPAYAALRFSTSIVRESYDNNYDIDFHTAKDERGNEYIVKEVSEPSGFWFEVGVTEDQDKVMTILKEHFDVENEEKFCLGVNQTADSKYFRYLVKTPYSGDEITLEQASELYDALADETEITKFLYYEAYKMIYVLDLPSFPECGIVGMFPTDGYDKILKCVTDNDLNCEVIISDSDECWQGYQCVVSFDASAGLDERLDVFKKIYAETGLYSLAGASHGIFNFMPENYVFLTDNEAQKEQDPDPADDKSNGTITCGDIDASGTIDITDLTELSLALVGDKELTSEQKMAADVDGDGEITLADLAMLRQYLSKKIDSLGKTPNASVPSPAVTSDITDISDSCETVTVGVDVDKWGSALKSIMISSMDDYDEYIGINSEENKKLAKKGIEVNEEFFKTNRLAVMVDNSEGCNGVKYTLTGVKLDKDGNVHLYYDKEIPEFMTALASVFHYITVVPASENSESETIVHFNEIRERTYITDKCTIVNSTNVGFKGESYPVVSGMVTSMEQFEEEMSKNGIEPAGVIERLDISKEFFDDNFLVYQTLYSGNTNPKSRIYRLSFDKENNLRMDYITYTTVHYYEDGTKVSVGGEQMVYRMLAAAVPKSVIDPSDVASFVSNGHSQEGENGYRIINQINEKSVKSASKTEVESKGNTVNISLIDSMEGFDRINDLYDGKYTHIKDELLTDNFFKDNVLYIADQPSVKKNIEYKIEDLMVKSNGVLEVTVGTSINNDEPDEDDNTEWHLAAAIPRSELVFDNINADTKIQ